MTAQRPRDALHARLLLLPLPAPDDEDAAPTRFFRNLLDRQAQPAPEIDTEALFSDFQHLQHRLTAALERFHQHRACHGIEFCVVLAKHGPAHARPFLADIAHWIAEFDRLILPEASAVPPRVAFLGRVR